MAERPAVGVVIPTHGRETRLAFCLEALAAQTLPAERFEVVVVRGPGATGPFAEPPPGLRVRFLDSSFATPPGKRNDGWRASEAELVAFTDDDCRPDERWLEMLLAEHEAADDSTALIQGRTEPDPDERWLLHGLARSVEIDGPTPWFETCNIAYPRALLERLGGYDEAFEESGEDTDLGLRALAAGAEQRFAPGAVVRHAVVAQPLPAAVRRGWQRWETTPLVFKRWPEHRRHLFAGLFFNRSHAAVLAAGLGLAIARRHPWLAALAVAPFVDESIDRANAGPRGLARQLIHMPARFAREAAVTAGIVRGAIRHRTPII